MSTSNSEATAAAADADCPLCGFTDTMARTSSYKGTLKLSSAMHTVGEWHIGVDKFLKERPVELPMDEPEVLRFLQKNTTIPVPNVIADWLGGNGKFFLLTDQVPGKCVDEVWRSLAQDQKERVAEQVARYLDQIRLFKADRLQSLSGGPVESQALFGDSEPRGPTADLAKISDYIIHRKGARQYSQDELARIRDRVPEHKPFTLTHTGLGIWNIMVDDNLNVTGILNWEAVGYYPVWWEYVATSYCYSENDIEWKELLRERLSEKYEGEREFWKDLIPGGFKSSSRDCE